ncbi:hypothetical protein CI105_01485 [Candidatus Izimaplasma bacterium ZiA1]|uniref:prephenate dehydrogenase n=1 Tax=Candidatus Izimoplasma sp. ZiA1 TaxID=2024899 RepID=UPI000BAA88D3|nr:hypothetical protein CI105_01485 [Candidatus Izimaplasma bacterium ZiA1]
MKIGIIGLGIIGGGYAKALIKYGYEIYGIDKNTDTIEYALKENLITKGYTDGSDIISNLDVIFVCLYPKDTVDFIRKNQNRFKKNSVISDVSGIKRYISNSLIYEKEDYEIVLSHPIAGSELSGIKNSNEAIFHNSNFVICPHKYSTEENMKLIEILAYQIGFGNVSYISDLEHDKILGYTSHLTHAIAMALVNSDPQESKTEMFIGDSYKDLTRIANINEDLWIELFEKNKDNLIKHIDNFINELDMIKLSLRNKDSDTLKSIMNKSSNQRCDIDG